MFDGRNITSGLPDELVKVVDFLNEKASAGEFEFSDSVSYWENNDLQHGGHRHSYGSNRRADDEKLFRFRPYYIRTIATFMVAFKQ